jgi:ketosteroid isomerase-like protein
MRVAGDTGNAVSQENIQIVRAIFDADRRRDVEAVQAAYAPEIEWEDNSGMWGDWGVARGIDGIYQAWSRWYEAFEDVQMEFGPVAAVGDDVVVTYPLNARGRESGVEVTQPFTLVWTIRDRKVVRVRSYSNRADGLAAVGLAE